MLVSSTSPAPRSTPSRAQATASRPVGVRRIAGALDLLGVDRQHHALRAELLGELVEQLRPRDRGRVHAHLVGPGVEDGLGVADGADPAADRERDEDVVGGAPRELDDRVALLVRGRDVEEHELVGALGVVALGQLDRIAGVADVDEVRALDDAARVDVEARDHALEVHAPQAR
jgi:hypothetical protein